MQVSTALLNMLRMLSSLLGFISLLGYQRAVRDVACLVVTVPCHSEFSIEIEELTAAVVVLDQQGRVFDSSSPFVAFPQNLFCGYKLTQLELGGDHVKQGLEDFFFWLFAIENLGKFFGNFAYMFSESMLILV